MSSLLQLYQSRQNWAVLLVLWASRALETEINGQIFMLSKVPILKEVTSEKCKVEHFFNIFVLTFGRDCYCIQQSCPKVRTNML